MSQSQKATQERTVTDKYQAERNQISERPCSCVRCDTCKGNGTLCVEVGTGKMIGPYPYDDLFDLTRCDECDNGIVEVCQRCGWLEELDRFEEEEHERQSI